MPGARWRRLGREAAAAPPARARGHGAGTTAKAAAAKSGPPFRPARVPRLARLGSHGACPRPVRGRRRRRSCTSSGLARHCHRSPSRHAQRVMKWPRRRRAVAPLGIRPRRAIGAKVNEGRFTWPKFDPKKKKKKKPFWAPRLRGLRRELAAGGGVGFGPAPAGPELPVIRAQNPAQGRPRGGGRFLHRGAGARISGASLAAGASRPPDSTLRTFVPHRPSSLHPTATPFLQRDRPPAPGPALPTTLQLCP